MCFSELKQTNGDLILTREKLVRDKIPGLIHQSGEEPRIRIASREEMDELLRAKIVEEAIELSESGEVEEIADIMEAIDTLLKLRGIEKAAIEKIRKKKNASRGAFTKGYVLVMET